MTRDRLQAASALAQKRLISTGNVSSSLICRMLATEGPKDGGGDLPTMACR
ncbi:hypothetical protein H6F86_29300 [Phormidium sp. FACHB-592]|uniref:Uncharacterized protein n=1 Tax=Stenomitos frigidus AS-A4 TaxID=2933935 RepID=A0ABV0KQX7_9CYAN|nr:hypothetical protein [Phormidium sp. FACHB-592]MBD2077911.1 hypothetical protein [Phormidium sp. FACHB-592]